MDGDLCGQPLASALASLSGGGGGGCALISSVDFLANIENCRERDAAKSPFKTRVSEICFVDDLRWRSFHFEFSSFNDSSEGFLSWNA